jgi:PAS domain S-box-containing protein
MHRNDHQSDPAPGAPAVPAINRAEAACPDLQHLYARLAASEHALSASRQILERITDIAPATLYIYDLEQRQNTYANRSIFATLGYHPAEVAAMGVDVFARLLHPADLALLPERLAKLRATDDRTVVQTEYRMRHADGTWRWLLSREVVFARNAAGTPTQILGVVQDITEQITALEAVRRNEELYRTLFATMAQGVVYQDASGAIVSANPAAERILGLTLDQLQGRQSIDPRWRAIHGDGAPFPGETHPAMVALRTGQPVHDVLMGIFHPQEGAYRWINVNARPQFRPGEPRPFQVYTTFEDITARKAAEDEVRNLNADLEARVHERTRQLEAAIDELEAFSYSVSHDLRAPLRAIDGFSRIVWEEYADRIDAEGREYLRLVRDNTRQMGQLIDDLLSFSRLNRQSLHTQPVSMDDLVRNVLADFATESAGRTIELSVEALPPCSGDPALLRLVWMNLIENAFKYTRRRDPARISITSSTAAGAIIYAVSDNGIGFDMQYAAKLFGVFQRLHRVDEYEGTGVGLATVQRVIQRHGGRVWAEATPDNGATFAFTLPTP